MIVDCHFLCLDTKKVTKEKSRQTRSLRAFCLANASLCAAFFVKLSYFSARWPQAIYMIDNIHLLFLSRLSRLACHSLAKQEKRKFNAKAIQRFLLAWENILCFGQCLNIRYLQNIF